MYFYSNYNLKGDMHAVFYMVGDNAFLWPNLGVKKESNEWAHY
jgi:hypothetical protein